MAKVEFVCVAEHGGEALNGEGPTITVSEAKWAFCLRGGLANHVWNAMPPTEVEALRTRGVKIVLTREDAVDELAKPN